MNTARYIRRNNLIRQLFLSLKNKYAKNLPIELEIFDSGLPCNLCFHGDTEIIKIDYTQIKRRVKEGYSNDYYLFRSQKLNPIIKNNKHNAIRFILLHELKHAIDYQVYKIKQAEVRADNFAIKKLKEVK